MGITIGDCLSVIGFIVGTCIALWALMVGVALLFGKRVFQAEERLKTAPWKALGTGALLAGTVGVIGVGFWASPNGLLKLIGYILSMIVLALAVIGGAGLAQMVGERIRSFGSPLPPFDALQRGAALIVLAALVPFFGWFFFLPLTILTALGAGFYAFWPRAAAPERVPEPGPQQDLGATP
jgi:hypothetical protein